MAETFRPERRGIAPFASFFRNSAVSHLGIELIEIGTDFLRGRMPVDQRTKQPAGILHGGASVLLAETLCTYAAHLMLASEDLTVVGQEINANRLRPATAGWVTGTTRPVHLGRRSQVWETRIEDEAGRLVCVSRMTLAVIDRPAPRRDGTEV